MRRHKKNPEDPLSIALILLQLTWSTAIHFVSKYSSRFWIFIFKPQSAYSPKLRSLWESVSEVTGAFSSSSSHTEPQTTLSLGKRCLKCKYLYPWAPPFGFEGSIIPLNNQCNSVSGYAPIPDPHLLLKSCKHCSYGASVLIHVWLTPG